MPCPLQIFRTALDSGEYVHIRNSLIILNKIVKVSTASAGSCRQTQPLERTFNL